MEERPPEGFENLFNQALGQSGTRRDDTSLKDSERIGDASKAALRPDDKIKTSKPHFHDHRTRLRDKFARRGAEAFDDYELLELILFQALPRIDTKPIAKALIGEFGSLAEVVAAPIGKLTKIKGIGPNAAQHLKILQQVGIRIGQSSIINRPILSSWNALLDYCRAAMQFEGREQFRVLFLDRKNTLLADEILGQGTVDRAPVYPREIVRRCLVHEATAIILVHNHPSGDPTPSRQDIDLTQSIIETAKAIDVTVHDHLVVGRKDVASFKMLGLM
ncbi:DNA repair protein RadC [uncultured Algimonas sp.]|uniref:RadC family protein n=1 Tax=uncultured Algimonas sp. TaxID=1547920 RepID=UPI00261DF93D|nr:DNA repair protein RadC [uncultured Algimonas sp.]